MCDVDPDAGEGAEAGRNGITESMGVGVAKCEVCSGRVDRGLMVTDGT